MDVKAEKTTTMTEIETNLEKIMRRVFDQDELIIRRELTARDVEGWDSLALVRLVVAVEKEFKIKLNMVEIPRLKSVGDFIDLIAVKKAGG